MTIHPTDPMPDAALVPPRIDTETTIWFRSFLIPLFDRADSWAELQSALHARGYRIAFRAGHMTIIDLVTGNGLCTGTGLGAPLASLIPRFGRPKLRLTGDQSGELVCDA